MASQDSDETAVDLTPPIPIGNLYSNNTCRENESQLSQICQLLPPSSSQFSQFQQASSFPPPPQAATTATTIAKKISMGSCSLKPSQVILAFLYLNHLPVPMILPTHQSLTFATFFHLQVIVSVDELRNLALRALKKLPSGEVPSMWLIMSNLDITDMKNLCRYCGVSAGSKTKADLGGIVFAQLNKGAFKSLFKSEASQRRPPKSQTSNASASDNATFNSVSQASKINVEVSRTASASFSAPAPASTPAPAPAPNPVLAFGTDDGWRPVEPAVKLLLQAEDCTSGMENGLYIDSRDWHPCSVDLEAAIEGCSSAFAAKEMLRQLVPGRRRILSAHPSVRTSYRSSFVDDIGNIRQGCIFPELQSLMTRRMSIQLTSVSTQTDAEKTHLVNAPRGAGRTTALATACGGETPPSNVAQQSVATSTSMMHAPYGLAAVKLVGR